MIVRTGPVSASERHIKDHGPTPAPTHARGSISGSIVVAPPTKPAPKPRPRTFDPNEWKRRKRATDPEWAERDREKARERARRARA